MKSIVHFSGVACVSLLASLVGSGLANAATLPEEVQIYCNSMMDSGLEENEARALVQECLEEQRGYFNESEAQEEAYPQESYQDEYPDSEPETYQEAPETEYEAEPDCYQEVDEKMQSMLDRDPGAEIDYDQLLMQCQQGR